MGWYVTCTDCKVTEKYRHPDCGCKPKREAKICSKMIDHQVVEVLNLPNASIFHLRKESADLYISFNKPNCSPEQAERMDSVAELSLEEFSIIKISLIVSPSS